MNLSPTHLLILLAIALVIFGTKRIRSLGSDLGAAVKGFKNAVAEGETDEQRKQLKSPSEQKDADFDSTPAKAKTETK